MATTPLSAPGKYDFDLVVIGAGPAGEKGAVQAAYFGKRVAIVEREREPGGAAVHTGTLPSKTLRETALYLSGHRQRELYGLSVELTPGLAVPKLLSRNQTVRDLEVGRFRWNLERHGVEYVGGVARLIDPHTVEVTPKDGPVRRVTSEFFLVATGSAPFRPANMPWDDPDTEDSDTVLELDRLPKDFVVIGGGVIGCEYATIFASLNVKVTLIEGRPRLLPFLDLEMGDRLRASMQTLGVDIRLETTVTKVERGGGKLQVTLGNGETIAADKLLAASGRSGRTDGLGLQEVGVGVDKRGYVRVDGDYKTGVPSVYAAGDVIGFPGLASSSMEQARVAVCHAFGFTYKRQVSTLIPYGIYTIPEVSSVGLSEEQATQDRVPYVVGRAFYKDNARGKIVGDKEGVLKLLFDAQTHKLIGCHCIGDRASELVHIGQAVITLGGGVETFIDMVFNYPTLSEVYKYAAYDALGALARKPADGPAAIRGSERPASP